MKTTLNWYKREANTYNQLGQRLLHKRHGFEGLGKFSALCDILVTMPNCELNIKDDAIAINMLALDLDFTPDEFTKFINSLIEFNLLVKTKTNLFSTQEIIDSLEIAMEERVKAYVRKYGKEPTYNLLESYIPSSPELLESSPELLESSQNYKKVLPNISQRERKRDKTIENTERENLAHSVFNSEFKKELKDNFELKKEKIQFYQTSFLKFFKMAKKKWKNEDDFRAHFLNWLKLELQKEKNSDKKETEKIGARQEYN